MITSTYTSNLLFSKKFKKWLQDHQKIIIINDYRASPTVNARYHWMCILQMMSSILIPILYLHQNPSVHKRV